MRSISSKSLTALALGSLSLSASLASAQSINLNTYYLAGTYNLPISTPVAYSATQYEASGVTWNRDTNTLFIVGDGGGYVMQTSLTGTPLNYMSLPAGGSPQGNEFYDPEGLAYVGNNTFVMTEERYRNAVQFTYTAGGTLQRANTQNIKLGTTVGNTGLEGLTYDPSVAGNFIFVNQRNGNGGSLQNIFQSTLNFTNGTASNGSPSTVNNTSLFPVGNLGFPTLPQPTDLADVYALSNITGYAGAASNNLLVLGLNQGIKEVTRTGTVVSQMSVPNSGVAIEGMTMDDRGFLYLVGDNGDFGSSQAASSLFVYAPIPEPAEYGMLLAGLGLIGAIARRRRAAR
jgi:uncharacterized protein YjiK